MFRILIILLVFAATSIHASNFGGASMGFADVDQDFRVLLEAKRVPGAAWAIVRDGRIVHAAGHGVRALDDQRSVTPETAFRIASVSKTFAAQITGQLVAEGKLHWNDPVQRFVPQFTLARPEHAQRLTLAHLLGQSAGIVPNAYDNLLNAGRTLDQILPQFGKVQPMCPPGECYTYQNVLFSLVEPAIESSSGHSYAELLRERVFLPLKMQQASVGLDGFLASGNRASPHVKVSRRRWVPTEVNENYYRVAPAAGVNASALDLGQWLAANMGYRPDVVRPELVRDLTRKRVHTGRELRRKGWRDFLSDAHYGLGWRIYTIDGHDLITHSGWVRGFVAQIAYSPEHDTGLALLLNAESSAISDLSIHFWRRVMRERPLIARDAPDIQPSGRASVSASGAAASTPD